MGKTYHRNKPADVDRSHAFKPAKTKVRLNARDVYAALDETADERTNIIPTSDEPGGYEPWPMMEGESDDPYVWVPGIGGRMRGEVLPFSQGRGRSVIAR